MKLMLLLGSGVSRATLGIGVAELTKAVVEGKWVKSTDGVYYPAATGPFCANDTTPIVQTVLRFLKTRADRYLAERSPSRIANYEDLFFLARQLADDQWGAIDNPALLEFVREMNAQVQSCLGLEGKRSPEGLAEIATEVCDFIQCVVMHSLATEREPVGLGLIEGLANSPEIESLDIFTLNHDLLVERLLQQREIPFADGFGELGGGHFRFLEPSVYYSDKKVRLFKLHGSVHWQRFRPERGGVFGDRYAIRVGGRSFYGKDSRGEWHDTLDPIPRFLTGSQNKLVGYGSGPVAEMHWWLHKLLRERTLMAVSGYGWRDKGINVRLIEWLYGSTARRLCIMHRSPQELEDASPLMRRCLGFLTDQGRITTIRKWMEAVPVSELMDALRA